MKYHGPLLLGLVLVLLGQGQCPTGEDADNDDWTTEQGDCDDRDATTYPGAPEVCDGKDNNCDGLPEVPGADPSCPAQSCKTILSADPNSPSGPYFVQPSGGSTVYEVYCDMSSEGGGWTRINGVTEEDVDRLRGSAGRKLLKCSQDGAAYVMSPSFSSHWYWAASSPQQLGGTWNVNGTPQECGSNSEYDGAPCSTWWGFKCSNGPGSTNKLYPGVLDSPSAQYCADQTSAHTNNTFSICGDNNYRSYQIFVRSED